MKKIVVVGMGVVGVSLAAALEKKGLEVSGHDPGIGIVTPDAVKEAADCFFICVPTPFNQESRKIDLCHVRNALDNIPEGKLAVIRSTIVPGTTDVLQKDYPEHCILCSPEFLTEATALTDELHPARQLVGYPMLDDIRKVNAVGWNLLRYVLPKARTQACVPAREVEATKYFSNAFYAVKVAFANEFADFCYAENIDYDMVRAMVESDPMISNNHLDVKHGGYRGYGGKCLPKDVDALLGMDSTKVFGNDFDKTSYGVSVKPGGLGLLRLARMYNARLKDKT